MTLDTAAVEALWKITSATQIKPEYLLPVLNHESGLNPAATNGSYHGIGQNSPGDIQAYAGVDVPTYLSWSAAQQLSTVVLGYFSSIVKSYGAIKSGVRTYQAEFLPGTLATARSLDSVIAASPSAFYNDNPSLDPNHDGRITVGDLAAVVAASARTTTVQQAIADTYAIDASISLLSTPPENIDHIVYGDDFSVSTQTMKTTIIIGVIAAASAATAYAIHEGYLFPRRRR